MNSTLLIIISCIVIAIVFCILLAIANFSGEKFFGRFQEMNKKEAYTSLTPLEYIALLNRKYFDGKLQIVQISKLAGDAYSKGKLFLSADTINKNTLASYTIISHELGHAKQDKDGKKLVRLNRLRRFNRAVGTLMLPSFIAGVILAIIGQNLFIYGMLLIGVGFLIFILALLTKLIMISIEKDASKNAVVFLSEIFQGKQLKECKKFLKDARLTYWGDFLKALFGFSFFSKKTKLFN